MLSKHQVYGARSISNDSNMGLISQNVITTNFRKVNFSRN